MSSLLVPASILLFAVSVISAALYYRRIRGLREKYEEASDVVGDVVTSFNSQLQVYERKLEAVSNRTGVLFSDYEETRSEVKEQGTLLKKLAAEGDTYSGLEQKLLAQIQDVNERVDALASAQKEVAEKLAGVENLEQRLSAAPKAERVKIDAPIPIKREKALAPLTETELLVLKSFTDNSPKTAPEIRAEIKLTREHTARLMKKLYEEGYLERGTQRIPYTYRIKKEMLKLLRKQV